MSGDTHRRILGAVMAGHFAASFAALGMPPFFALILERSLHSDTVFLAGWLYVVPTFFTAISSPWWGRLADRFGKKPLLLRAQLGLAASFLLAGFAPNAGMFFAALLLQGLLGGTFSASNAYLATIASGTALVRSLTLMQWSARASLVVAPAGLGMLMMTVDSPLVLYRYLALLPLCAALLIWRLPSEGGSSARPAASPANRRNGEATPRQIYALQFLFIFATVLTFPYFVPFIEEADPVTSTATAGWLFGLPHLVYLLCAVPLGRWLGQRSLILTLALSCLALALALLGQGLASGLPAIVAWRVLMGMAMTAIFIGLHALTAAIVHGSTAGATFGWFESSAKWGGVVAGLVAGAVVHALDMRAPFFIGAMVMFIVACALAVLAVHRLRISHP